MSGHSAHPEQIPNFAGSVTVAISPTNSVGSSMSRARQLSTVVSASITFHMIVLLSVDVTTLGSRLDPVPTGAIQVRIVATEPSSRANSVEAIKSEQSRTNEQPMPVAKQSLRKSQSNTKPDSKETIDLGLSPSVSAIQLPPGYNESEYLPTSRLTTRPVPIGDIVIPYPDGFDPNSVRSAILTVFIDEYGVVERVRVDESELPPSILEKGKETFAKARFHPGRIEGKAVKSRMRIEIGLERVPVAAEKVPVPRAVGSTTSPMSPPATER